MAAKGDSCHNVVASIKYFPFGAARGGTGTLDTDIKFTGQRLDSGVDLYYYGTRYYDANIGRFISADTIVSSLRNPQTLNRYSYALNNPLRYIDPTGHQEEASDWSLVELDGTVSWAYGDQVADAIAAGASVLSMDDIATGNITGQFGAWSSSESSESGGNGSGNGPVTVAPSNPGAVIDAGKSTAPALPGETTAGVGGSPGILNDSNLENITRWADFVSSATALAGLALLVTGGGTPIAGVLFGISAAASVVSTGVTTYKYTQGGATSTDLITSAGSLGGQIILGSAPLKPWANVFSAIYGYLQTSGKY